MSSNRSPKRLYKFAIFIQRANRNVHANCFCCFCFSFVLCYVLFVRCLRFRRILGLFLDIVIKIEEKHKNTFFQKKKHRAKPAHRVV